MRKLITVLGMAGLVGLSAVSGSIAAPVSGFESFYDAVYSNCTLPDGAVPACETAINAYAEALVGAVDLDTANQSFSELRLEVFAANDPDPEFQAEIDRLFELLLPDSGAIGVPVSPT
jgi:hypothetical protein